jgi:hypothetical protein
MAKPRIFGSNAVYIPNNRRDKRRSKIPFQPSRQKKTKDRPKPGAAPQEKLRLCAGGRHSGKTAELIRRALDCGGVIGVSSEGTRQFVLDTAKLMGVPAPTVIVFGESNPIRRGVTFAGVIVDY